MPKSDEPKPVDDCDVTCGGNPLRDGPYDDDDPPKRKRGRRPARPRRIAIYGQTPDGCEKHAWGDERLNTFIATREVVTMMCCTLCGAVRVKRAKVV